MKMSTRSSHGSLRALGSVCLAAGVLFAPLVKADSTPVAASAAPTAASAQAASGTPMVNGALMNALHMQAPAAGGAPAATANSGTVAAQAAPASAPAQDSAPKPVEPPKVRVIYLSDSERERIKQELKEEVLKEAREQNWAVPHSVPEWVNRIHFSGDITVRDESDFYDKANSRQVFNFQSMVSSGSPTNLQITQGQPLPFPLLNTTENRNLLRERVHLGLHADVSDTVESVIRLSTGNSGSPASPTVTLGSDFARQNFLLDRAYINYHASGNLSLAAGRMENPFYSPTRLMWYDQLSFDGLAAQYHPQLTQHTAAYLSFGGFSVLNTDPNFGATAINKTASRDSWLYGLQLGALWVGDTGTTAQGAVGLYDFININGVPSAPCYAPTSSSTCDTDNTRPAFVQKGNTMILLRNLQLQNPSTDAEYQYFGLASKFNVLNIAGSIDTPIGADKRLAFDGSYVRNLAFNRQHIAALDPVNNLGSCSTSNCVQGFNGGRRGFELQTRIGDLKIKSAGQWNVFFGYKWVQSDAVVDAFTDADFNAGGTNTKGYYIGGNLGFSKNAWLTARFMSSQQITGLPFSVDIAQIDVNTRF